MNRLVIMIALSLLMIAVISGKHKDLVSDLSNKNELVVIFTLSKSQIAKQLKINHVQVLWKCQYKGKDYEGGLGFTGDFKNQYIDMLKDGLGLSTLQAKFNDSRVENRKDVLEYLKSLRSTEVYRYSIDKKCKSIILAERVMRQKYHLLNYSLIAGNGSSNCLNSVVDFLSKSGFNIDKSELYKSYNVSPKWYGHTNKKYAGVSFDHVDKRVNFVDYRDIHQEYSGADSILIQVPYTQNLEIQLKKAGFSQSFN